MLIVIAQEEHLVQVDWLDWWPIKLVLLDKLFDCWLPWDQVVDLLTLETLQVHHPTLDVFLAPLVWGYLVL